MKNPATAIALALLFLSTSSALAAGTHSLEITGGTRGALNFSSGPDTSSLSLGADYRVRPEIQRGGAKWLWG